MVFGSKTSCPVCGALRPGTAFKSSSASDWPQGQEPQVSAQGKGEAMWYGGKGGDWSESWGPGPWDQWGMKGSMGSMMNPASFAYGKGDKAGAFNAPWSNTSVSMGSAPTMPKIASYGNQDNLTKLIRAAAPEPMRYIPDSSVSFPAAAFPAGPMDPAAALQQSGKDWFCKCGEINFRMRKICGKCFTPRHMGEQEDPTAGMEWADVCKLYREKKGRSRSKRRSRSKKKKKKRKRSSSSSSSDSSSRSKKKKKRSRSKTKAQVVDGGDVSDDGGAPAKSASNPEHDRAKHEALNKIKQLKEANLPLDERRRQWRALLREWHPDKHEDKDLATAVFQFLQKAKAMLDMDK